MSESVSKGLWSVVQALTGKKFKKSKIAEANEVDLAPTKPYEVLRIPMATLRIIEAPEEQALNAVQLRPGLLIGRGNSCGFIITDRNASRVHASFNLTEEGWLIRDNASRNGTFVNGKQVTTALLNSGDKIVLGRTVLKFEENS